MSPNLLLFHQSGIMIKLAVACGLFYKPGTSSNFAIMPVPRKPVLLTCPQETSSVSALIQACLFLLNKSLNALLCVCLIICYIAGKHMLS